MATTEQMQREVADQSRALREQVEGLADFYREVQAEAVADAYRDLIETSPVRTGAYRAEHVIEEGGDSGALLYESPNRVGPDAVVNPPVFIDAPQVEGRVESIGDFATVQISNRRYYAEMLEYGTATTEPRYVYRAAAVRAEGNLEQIAQRASRRRVGG